MNAERNRRIAGRISFLVAVCLVSLPAQAQYSGGRGTADDPYRIATAGDLIALGRTPHDYDKHFILTADIDLDPNLPRRKAFDGAVIAPNMAGYNPEVYTGTPFSGVFDGAGHIISHLHVDWAYHGGLFGQLAAEGLICNLGVEEVSLTHGYIVGGLVGGNAGGTISNCYTTGRIECGNYAGGLVGMNESGTIRECHSDATVTGKWSVGGLIGSNWYSRVWDCHSSGSVAGDGENAGGLIGENYAGTVWSCSSTASVTCDGNDVGGLVGFNCVDGRLVDCHTNNSVVGINHVGGLVGFNASSIVSMCSSRGSVTGDSGVGGLVGFSYQYQYNDERRIDIWLSNCHSSASVVGRKGVGGLVAHNSGDILNCYSCGSVSGTTNVGGLTGTQGGFFSVQIVAFWDVDSSGQVTSAAGTGLTSAQMQDPNTYRAAGWDLAGSSEDGTAEIWHIPAEGGYPILAPLSGYTPPRLQGQGTEQDPYLLHDAVELGAIPHYEPWAHYRLACPIDLAGIRWGTAVVSPFTGVLDGNDLSISNLTIRGTAYVGLIGCLEKDAEVRDLHLVDVNIVGSGRSVGALVGWSRGRVSGCSVTGAISGQHNAGGFVGHNLTEGAIRDCYSSAAITATRGAGGVAGGNGGLISNCENAGPISGSHYTGGLSGGSSGIIRNCRNTGPVDGNDTVGGVAGSAWIILDCHNSGPISGTINVGGVAGSNRGAILMSSNTGPVEATAYYVGGLVGTNTGEHVGGPEYGFVFACCNRGPVRGQGYVGGLIGYNLQGGSIWNSYNEGTVTDPYIGGGLVGHLDSGEVVNCYSTGYMTGEGHARSGLTGGGGGWSIGADSFWDTQTSGQPATDYGGTGLETAQMQMAQTYLDAGWDFVGETANGTDDIWWIDEGQDYPRLWWELDADAAGGL